MSQRGHFYLGQLGHYHFGITQELFFRPCYQISDFVLLITTSNVVWWNKNVKTTLQGEANEIFLCQVSKMSRWGDMTSTLKSHYGQSYSGIKITS
jgi:hypothetical protein